MSVSGPDAILVSARSHHVEELPENRYEDEVTKGLNFMRIDFDFQVGAEQVRDQGREPAALRGIGSMVIGSDFEIGAAERN